MSFMKIFLWRCKKNWFFEILLVVQLWFFIVGMLIMTSSIQKYTMGIRLLDKVEGLKDAWYWSIDDSAYIQKQTDLESTNPLHEHDESTEEHGTETEGHDVYLERIVDLALDTDAFVGIGDMSFSHFSTPKAEVDLIPCMVHQPDIILVDEPTGNLDSKTAADIMGLFRTLNEQGRTIVIVTHDDEVANCCQRIVNIQDGLIV